MNFLFPATTKHIPNDEQMKLLFDLLYDTEFSGFLNTSALTVTHREPMQIKNVCVRYTDPIYTSSIYLAEVLKTSPFLYLPFDQSYTYILDGVVDVVGLIRSSDLCVFWFETSISIWEIYSAEGHNVPIVTEFVNLGVAAHCTLCNGHKSVDWVNQIKALRKYKNIEGLHNRYVLANHQNIYFLIDNKFVHDYDGPELIHVCPRCLGSGVDGVIVKQDDNIKSINFDEHTMEYRLLVKETRPNLVRRSYDEY